tara:strand:+ start:828 stop:3533 length:2706 start_codon:yes stop_codon:yes gene_type:complete
MARKFSGAARAKGFSPIQVSNANINRMREENQRILEGMRARQESIRENDRRALQAMKEDAAYYQSVRDRDYRIEDQNIRTEIQQSRYDAAAEQAQVREDQKVMDAFVDSIVSISATAKKIQDEEIKKKNKKQEEETERIIGEGGGVDPLSLKMKELRDLEQLKIEQLKGNAALARQFGVPESIIQAELNGATVGSAHFIQQSLAQQTRLEWPSFRAEYLRELGGDVLSDPAKAQAAANEAWAAFKTEKGWDKFSPEFYGEAIKVKVGSDKVLTDGVEEKQTANFKASTITAVNNAVMANPTSLELSSGYRTVYAVTGSHTEAHEWLMKQATAMDANGEFILTDGQWMGTSLREDGKVYYTGDRKNPGTNETRGLAIMNAREEKRRQWNTNQATTDRQNYQEESKAWHRHIVVEGNNTPEDLAAAAESFKDDVQGMPEWLRKLRGAGDPSKGGYNSGLITTAKDLQARKMLNQDLVNKVFEIDPKLGNELQKSLNDQDPFMRNDRYKAMHEIVGKLNTKKDAFGQYPASTVSSYNDSQRLQENFEQLVRNGVADGASIDDAATNAGRFIEQGHNDESSPFYRRYNPNTGFYEYPQLYTKTAREIADNLDQADTEFGKKLASGQLQDVFSDPNMILTDIAFDKNIADMARPGYTFPARVEMLSEKFKASPMEIMQQIATAKGRPEIKPPPSLQIVGNYPPAAKALVQRFRSLNRDNVGHGMGGASIGTGWNEGLVPATLREFYRTSAEKHGISPAENSAMGEVESNHNTANVDPETGMSVSYNGTSRGPMMVAVAAHPEFYAQHGGNPSVEANIDYGTAYYASLKRQYDNDPIVAAMAYNGGPGTYDMWKEGEIPDWVQTDADFKEWNRIVAEMINHGRKFAGALYKYSSDPAILQHPLILRN